MASLVELDPDVTETEVNDIAKAAGFINYGKVFIYCFLLFLYVSIWHLLPTLLAPVYKYGNKQLSSGLHDAKIFFTRNNNDVLKYFVV